MLKPLSKIVHNPDSHPSNSAEKPLRTTLLAEPFPGMVTQGGVRFPQLGVAGPDLRSGPLMGAKRRRGRSDAEALAIHWDMGP